MDIGKSLTFIFDDERWGIKWVIAALFLFLMGISFFTIIGPLLVGMLLVGYVVALMRNVSRGDPRPLPEWDHFGDKFMDGLKLTVALFIWSLPAMILWFPNWIASMFMGDDGSGALALLMLCLSCFAMLYSIFLAIATPAIFVSFAEKGTFGSALDLERISHIMRKHLAEIVIIVIVLVIVGILASVVGMLLCLVGLLFTMSWYFFVEGHLYGQLAAVAAGDQAPGTSMVPSGDQPPAPIGGDEASGASDTGQVDPDAVVDEVKRQSQEALDEMDAGDVLDEPDAPPSVKLEPEQLPPADAPEPDTPAGPADSGQ
jgi:hypothetical protein